MLKKMSIVLLSIVCLVTQTGCITTGMSGNANDETNKAELRVHSETEEKILKEATVAGTIGGVAVSAIIIAAFGDDWPIWLKAAVGVGGTLVIKEIAEYIAMDQIATLQDITLENDEKEALLVEARKVNADVALLNADLKASVEKYKVDTTGLTEELDDAKANQIEVERAVENRKHLLDMLVEDSEQYKEFAQELAVLEQENATLASLIEELTSLEAGAV